MIKIEPLESPPFDKQSCRLGKEYFSVARLAQLTAEFEVMDIPLAHMNLYNTYDNLSLREMAGHIVSVNNADMTKPIILDEDGCIMDGRHRIMHAIVNGIESVKAVRFDVNPTPCSVDSDE